MGERAQMDPVRAAATRRAAALITHWQRKQEGAEGEIAVLRELGTDTGLWADLVCALLNLTEGLVKAARDGREDAYLAYVLREASLDEVSARE